MREYHTIRALRERETVEIEGMFFRMILGDIEIGDSYIAERNQGPKLLTAKKIIMSGEFPNYIVPEEMAYPYDWNECVRVELVENT